MDETEDDEETSRRTIMTDSEENDQINLNEFNKSPEGKANTSGR